ncbi:hypothetical protein FB567DRAFT_261911 [Paraphoma chrysanthemicola]|uniref:RED-like N-terminal domain-containing protein n=1 Tax=Paraphoma chrysanthemicola TaxID=798071 RepID=A0A8K0W2A6_9PLEO|nr:hypothetical protein FB567DRAFT_261911 [Paraphoma chrysanthemicola]
MNNQQFRRLLLSDTPRSDGDKSKSPAAGTPKAVLGARKHSSIPMTPRQLGRGSVQADFARQLAERNARSNPQKQARASAPKGTKLAAGYTDRTKARVDDEDNEIAKRIKNLEDSMKLGQIDRETFEHLVQEITGGDVGTTHLVKGLDRRLLERVRRGEDVLAGAAGTNPPDEDGGEDKDVSPAVEDAFDELAHEDISSIVHERAEKRGQKMTMPPPPVAGVKRSRNDILKDLKRQREEAAAAAAAEHEKRFPSLGAGFRKINAQGETSRIEIDARGREVLIITTLDGKEKRKVKKQKSGEAPPPVVRHDLDDAAKPINMHNLPEPKVEESEDDDIFEGVGSSYNPLADFDEGSDVSDETEIHEPIPRRPTPSSQQERVEQMDTSTVPRDSTSSGAEAKMPTKRDYFKVTGRDLTAGAATDISAADATVRAALAKVRNLDDSSTLLQNLSSSDAYSEQSKEARLRKRAAELAASDRDLEDMDLGFGASRFDDADDMEREGEKIKLSQWKGLNVGDDAEDGDEGARDAKKQRKRGSKKKRGDKNKAEDVLKVMERQKENKTLG